MVLTLELVILKSFVVKRRIAVLALFLYGLVAAVVVLTPLNPYGGGKWLTRGCDFMLRMTEIDCLLRGVNPYYVWHGDIVLKPYVPTCASVGSSPNSTKLPSTRVSAFAVSAHFPSLRI